MAALNWRVFGREIIPENYGCVCPRQLESAEDSSYKLKVPGVHLASSISTHNV